MDRMQHKERVQSRLLSPICLFFFWIVGYSVLQVTWGCAGLNKVRLQTGRNFSSTTGDLIENLLFTTIPIGFSSLCPSFLILHVACTSQTTSRSEEVSADVFWKQLMMLTLFYCILRSKMESSNTVTARCFCIF